MAHRLVWVALFFIALFSSASVALAAKRKTIVPNQPRVVQDVPRPLESDQVTDTLINTVTGPSAVFEAGVSVPIEEYARCVHHMSRLVDPIHRVFHNMGRVDPNDGSSPDGFTTSSRNTSAYISPLPAWCRFQWIPRHELFEGLDSIVFLGDSVLLRAFHDIFMVSNDIYFQKIVTIDGLLNGTITLRSGRIVKVFFYRNLFAVTLPSTLEYVLDPANGLVTSRSLVVSTLGMHDARWLVFRQAPPGYRKGKIGAWDYARRYWNKHAGNALDALSHMLERIQNKSIGGYDAPFFVFRDPVPPSCDHPKYANRPKITRCPDLLAPYVLPWYRDTIAAGGAIMGIPMVSVDAFMPPCGLIDAGHLYRWCKEGELQLIIQAFRLGKRLRIVQGRHIISPKVPDPMGGLFNNGTWVSLTNRIVANPFTVNGLPLIAAVPLGRVVAGQPYFRIRFDGVSVSRPQWLPSKARDEWGEPGLTPGRGTFSDSAVLVVLGENGDTVRDAKVNDDAVALYYNSIRLGVYLSLQLSRAQENGESHAGNFSQEVVPDPWSIAAYFEQPSLSRWGYYYARNATTVFGESEEAANTSLALLPFDASIVERVGRMVQLGLPVSTLGVAAEPVFQGDLLVSSVRNVSEKLDVLDRVVLPPHGNANGEGGFLIFGAAVCALTLIAGRALATRRIRSSSHRAPQG